MGEGCRAGCRPERVSVFPVQFGSFVPDGRCWRCRGAGRMAARMHHEATSATAPPKFSGGHDPSPGSAAVARRSASATHAGIIVEQGVERSGDPIRQGEKSGRQRKRHCRRARGRPGGRWLRSAGLVRVVGRQGLPSIRPTAVWNSHPEDPQAGGGTKCESRRERLDGTCRGSPRAGMGQLQRCLSIACSRGCRQAYRHTALQIRCRIRYARRPPRALTV